MERQVGGRWLFGLDSPWESRIITSTSIIVSVAIIILIPILIIIPATFPPLPHPQHQRRPLHCRSSSSSSSSASSSSSLLAPVRVVSTVLSS
eukprot:3586368-Pyramimonas_sp.AAC.1